MRAPGLQDVCGVDRRVSTVQTLTPLPTPGKTCDVTGKSARRDGHWEIWVPGAAAQAEWCGGGAAAAAGCFGKREALSTAGAVTPGEAEVRPKGPLRSRAATGRAGSAGALITLGEMGRWRAHRIMGHIYACAMTMKRAARAYHHAYKYTGRHSGADACTQGGATCCVKLWVPCGCCCKRRSLRTLAKRGKNHSGSILFLL